MSTRLILVAVSFLLLVGNASAVTFTVPEEVRRTIEAQRLLAKARAEFREDGGILQAFNIALAVKRGDEQMRVIYLDGHTCRSKSKLFITDCIRRRGAIDEHTQFLVYQGHQRFTPHTVYAVRMPLLTRNGYKESVFTPYMEHLNTDEVAQYGKEYLQGTISKAYNELASARIRSAATEGKYVHQVVPKEFIEQLILVEHGDPTRTDLQHTANVMRQIYVNLAINRSNAYRYVLSPANAQGILQIIPRTYAGIRDWYPHAGIIDNFDEGTGNQVNAMKVAVLLIDHNLRLVDEGQRQQLLGGIDMKKLRDFAASSYNGSPRRSLALLGPGRDHVRDNDNRENRRYVRLMRTVAMVTQNMVFGQ